MPAHPLRRLGAATIGLAVLVPFAPAQGSGDAPPARSDLARLAPPDTVVYAELDRPGEQLQSLVGALGLDLDDARIGISPRLIDGLLGMRGCAIALTDVDPQQGPRNGIAIVDPGDHQLLRGLLETVLPIAGEPVEPIGRHPTVRIDGEVFVTSTERLVVASPDPVLIAGVLARLDAGGGDGGLAARPELAAAMAMRGDDLLFFCVHLAPLMPRLMDLLERQTRNDPGARAGLAFVDLPSARFVAGRAGVGPGGLSFDLGVELAEGHHNLAFHLLRQPSLDRAALDMVPAGSAMFAAVGVNPAGALPAGATDGAGAPTVSLFDLGRELFANVNAAALFALPSAQRTPSGPLPDAALVLRVNDPARSRALWHLALGTAQAATGGGEPRTTTRGGAAVDHFTIDGMSVLVAVDGQRVIVSPSPDAVDAALAAGRDGAPLRGDPLFAPALAAAERDCPAVLALNVGRCGALAAPFLGDRDRREAAPIFAMLERTTVALRVEHGAHRFAVHGALTGLPDLGPMVEQLVQRELHSRRSAPIAMATAPDRSATAGSAGEAIAACRRAQAAGDIAAASRAAERVFQLARDDARTLNDFAWSLLTDPTWRNGYDGIAREMARRACELTEWGNWYFVDTYAHAQFRLGHFDDAIEFERRAVALAGDDPRAGEARAALERFVAARAARGADGED
ncbi:MAG: hypothetical protein IPM29_23085 [Planctomycetes bacterium]|nr:hypothetical protein [Planctomycetota bacterium]